MKPIKVYKHSLNYLFILDTENKTRQSVYVKKDLEIGEPKRITKATINKYRKDYEKNYSNTYVVTSPILANFSDNEEEIEHHKNRAINDFIGEYESIEKLKEDFLKMYDSTKVIRKKYHFVNFASSLLDVMNSFITGRALTAKKEIEIARAIKIEAQ